VQGADAVAVSPDGASVYVAFGLQDGFASFARDPQPGALSQLKGTPGCFLAAIAQACGLGRAFKTPEGVAISPDGTSVYVGAFGSSAVDTFACTASTGALTQDTRPPGCIVARRYPTCRTGRARWPGQCGRGERRRAQTSTWARSGPTRWRSFRARGGEDDRARSDPRRVDQASGGHDPGAVPGEVRVGPGPDALEPAEA
jgi:hypothetical protein